MVEVFKTNVQESTHANQLLAVLTTIYPASRINFDLDDCDKILRVKGEYIQVQKIIQLLEDKGYQCEVLV